VTKITWDSGFKRAYKRKVKANEQLKTQFWNAIALFQEDPFHSSLKTHKLTGKLKGLWAFAVSYWGLRVRSCNITRGNLLPANRVLLFSTLNHTVALPCCKSPSQL
jgi:mRNA-degrading endonuclease YafQ of YafQ-DinJ toxin-antitoxin module